MLLAIGIALLGGSVFAFVRASERAAAAGEWPTAEGRVLTADVEERYETSTDSDGSTRTTRMLYPKVTYAYAVGGRSFRNDDIWLMGQQGFSSPASAFDVLRSYPQGRPVTVHYDPADPADAALILEGTPWWVFLIGAMGLAWLAAGLFAFRPPRRVSAGIRGHRPASATLESPAASTEDYGHCRSCGARLPVPDHYFLETRRYDERHEGPGSREAAAGIELRWVHVPCPRCGEAEPLNSLRHTWRQALLLLAFGIVFAGIVGTILWMALQ
jgi:predicted RNA-binding Zn-ribbon protein involved in translation (DUF1610 family)